MNIVEDLVVNISKQAKVASHKLSLISNEEKIKALHAMALAIREHQSYIKAENALDMKIGQENGLNSCLLDRLFLNDQRIASMIASIEQVAMMPDPVGKLITSKVLPNGIHLKKIRVPLGVIGVIFESRPNVLTDVAALCLKSGNAVILRGGKESQASNRALMKVIDDAFRTINFTPFAVQMIPVTNKEAVSHLCKQSNFIDVIIPRGGENLIKAVEECATVPVIKHYKGVCHAYIDAISDICQRPGVCNSLESIIVHESIAKDFLPLLFDKFNTAKVEMRGCENTWSIIPEISRTQASDWGQEFLDLIVTIKVVKNIDEAINHINTYGSHHSDAIISLDKEAQNRFVKEIDSACVYVNASTRFTDGGVFGLGCEIGISTDKLHARGPMGLEELCSYKWVALGNGQIRE
jgi:glutamate-5-semialdehyde dehydrogenase